MPSAKFEQDPLWFQRGVENLKEEVAVLETQLAELEQKNLRSPVLLQKLGEYFGFGAAGKLGWARFKLNFKQEQLDRFEAQPKMLKVTAKRYDTGPEPSNLSVNQVENLKEEVAVLETQLAELEQKNLRSPVLLQKLGEYFGFGAAGKLSWARFKLNFKQEQLDRFEAQPEMLKIQRLSPQFISKSKGIRIKNYGYQH